MSIFQKAAIALARSPGAGRLMRATAAGSALASRFVGGATAGQAAATAARLRERHGIRASLFYLGEYVADPAIIEQTVGQTVAACRALEAAGLDVHVSIDPTAIGYAHSDALGRDNARRIASAARRPPAGARLGGAGHGGRRHPRAYLRAASGTAGRRLAGGPDAAGAAPAHLAGPGVGGAPAHLAAPGQGAFPVRALDHRGRARIDAAYLEAAAIMLSPQARAAGFLPVFGTHDDRLAGALMALARERGWAPDEFEFEMLYGVRTDWQLALRAMGYNLRVYLPFGADWWPYAIRRVGSIPATHGCWRDP